METNRMLGRRSGVVPVNLFAAESEAGAAEYPSAAELRQWAREHLCRAHPDLGRPGPVCPYMSHAIAHRFLWAVFVGGRDIEVRRIVDIVDDLYDLFPLLPPRDPPDSQFRAVLAVFPELIDHAALDTVQRDLKTGFVTKGLMLGQFYPGCTYSGLHNPAFPALDAPLPILAIRHMAPTDYPFLESRHEWIDAYLRIFAPAIPDFVTKAMSGQLVRASASPEDAP
ncbi:DUF6875 domain-containing protein [Nocardia sp. NBC_01329]|uniref:DUF6875 domain-containing protein n=1 Tax=Nocardia sp. NBC_01329 TaxID=2903594 RepID=UPI002E1555A9|nr:hypothetical protein OG405_08955 [Nocardia sp. NBC_01329]